MSAGTYLLDTSFLIDLADEMDASREGPAHRALGTLPERGVYITPVTVAELLDGAENRAAALRFLTRFQRLMIGDAAARRCAINQSRSARRMGENDAWQAALAFVSGHKLVGHDRTFENRPWLEYVDHRRF